MYRKSCIIFIIITAGIYACNKDSIEAFNGFKNPAGFPKPVYHFSTNEITKESFELGRKLFYDPVLSANNTISCASCHIQTAGFTHHGHSVSHGIYDRLGTRNTPAIINLAWSTAFMWDGGVFDLDLQPIAPITNHVEMDNTMATVLGKLSNHALYPALFKKAFGTDEVTSAFFLKALSQFMLMCVSSNSKYDSVIRNQSFFTADEQKGYELFKQKCSNCHKEPLFTDNSFRNNGLGPSMVNDEGRYAVSLNINDQYKFKVPSLRNLDYTPPYMHDGRLLTLEAVLDHYAAQVKNTVNLDPLLKQNGRLGIDLSSNEKLKILSFLNTLNDRVFVTNKRFFEQ